MRLTKATLTSLLLALALAAGCNGGGSSPPPAQVIPLTVQEADTMIAANQGSPDFVILDVRTPGEFAAGHLEDAVNIDFNSGTFDTDVGALDRIKTYLVHCQAGSRSAMATADMLAMGFGDLYDMVDGFGGWVAAGLPWTQ
ncbi:MAG: rhodanese-like domain-containing protein [Planctomycetota bacterium]|jgi:rhodanese-related sulfurtransferase